VLIIIINIRLAVHADVCMRWKLYLFGAEFCHGSTIFCDGILHELWQCLQHVSVGIHS